MKFLSKSLIVITTIFLALLLFNSSANAITTASPSTNGQKGLINLLSPNTMGMGRLSVGGYYIFGASAEYDKTHVKPSSLSDYFHSTGHIGISYGITDFLDINTKISLAMDYSDEHLMSKFNVAELGLKYSIWRNSVVKMGFNLYSHFPIVEELTGADTIGNGYHRNFRDEILYTEKAGYGARILASIGSKGMETFLNIGYMMRHSEGISDIFTGGIGFDIAADEMTSVFVEFDGEFYLSSPKIAPMRAGGGLRFHLPHEISLTAGGYAGINEEAPVWQAVLGMTWSGVVVTFDTDGDGIVDKLDKCPEKPEDMDGFEDEDGCPDLDNDNDGIVDLKDKCPNTPEDMDGFEDDDGCPEADNDNDKILDKDDKCPNEPEDLDGFEDLDGCPDLDNDGDKILDKDDKCPNKPEDMDGFEDEDGCPENDNDKDGILDDNDKCPDEPETFNDFEDEDGCPDAVILKKNDTIVLDNIYFKTGKAELTIDSFNALDKVKRIFIDNPKVKIQIEGHSDSQGSAKYNLKLSNRRARAVLEYLVTKLAVPITQVTSVGFGEEHPIADNKTKEGRAKNRRIEFKVLSNE